MVKYHSILFYVFRNLIINEVSYLSEVKTMQEGIHPKYEKAVVRCACGETFETGSTKAEMRVEICSQCHPFFTGKQKLVDTGGREIGRAHV